MKLSHEIKWNAPEHLGQTGSFLMNLLAEAEVLASPVRPPRECAPQRTASGSEWCQSPACPTHQPCFLLVLLLSVPSPSYTDLLSHLCPVFFLDSPLTLRVGGGEQEWRKDTNRLGLPWSSAQSPWGDETGGESNSGQRCRQCGCPVFTVCQTHS